MKLAVIIPTYGRSLLLAKMLAILERQTRAPDCVFISAPDESHAPAYAAENFPISRVFGHCGGCAQRNAALEHVLGRYDIVTFFDDDFLPQRDYLQRLECAFAANPDWAVIRGEAVHDGASGPGYSFEQGAALLESIEAEPPPPDRAKDHVGGYGCNMSIRTAMIGDLRFDERLPLYGWQEDIDFTSQLRRHGRIVGLTSLRGVHLAEKSGRQSGLRLGYSQIANPLYLWRKGTMPSGFAVRLMTRNFAANLVRGFWPEPYIDRAGRLRGNLLAALHAMKGRVDPEHILQLE